MTERIIAALASAGVLTATLFCLSPAASAAEQHFDRVVVFGLPGVTWELVSTTETPALDRLIDDAAVAAMSTRTAIARPNTERGWLTIGTGNRAFVAGDDPQSHLAFEARSAFEGGTAMEALRRRLGTTRTGEVVHLGLPYLAARQQTRLYGAIVGALGETLAEAGVPRAVVSAADLAVEPTVEDLRRSAVLAIVDRDGTVDRGSLDGLLREASRAPFGVETASEAFMAAVDRALGSARVVFVDPGETSRADEFARFATPERAAEMRRQALARADSLLGDILPRLRPSDLLLVVAPSSPTTLHDSQLTPMAVAGGPFGGGWALSSTTQRPGMTSISDVAPTILGAVGADVPPSMDGTEVRPVRDGEGGGRIDDLVALNERSLFREHFAIVVFYSFGAGLFSLVAILAFIVFLGASRKPLPWLVGLAYLTLAVPVAAHLLRVAGYWHLPLPVAHIALWTVAAALAAVGWVVPGPRWAGGVALMLAAALAFASDAALGGPLQVNGIFGHSPVVAGRYYGLSNPGHAILYSATLLGFAGLIELRARAAGKTADALRRLTAPRWFGLVLVAAVLLVGLPQFGANFGGLITGVAGGAVAYALARGHRIRVRWLLLIGLAALALGVALTLFDLARPVAERTHLGRFAADVGEGGLPALATIVQRKASSAFATVRMTQWSYVIPVAVAVLALLLWRPRGILRDVLPDHPVVRAALWGGVIVAVVGFLVNDSGIAIPALVLAHMVPFLVLMAADTIAPQRGIRPWRKPAPAGD